jgi:hypothetical protein
LLPFTIGPLDVAIGQRLDETEIKVRHAPLECGANVGEWLRGFDPDVFNGNISFVTSGFSWGYPTSVHLNYD